MPRILVAKTTAMIEHDGRRIVVKQGITTAREGHAVVKEHPELWVPQSVTFETESEPVKESNAVETATAAPGEKRTVTTTSAAPTRRGRRTGGTSKEGSGE